MKKIITAMLIGLSSFALADTAGSALLNFKTSTYYGHYAPKHCLAAWITKSDGTYVKSLEVRAHFPWYGTYLTKWKASSAHNTGTAFSEIDAISGASMTAHTAHTLTWNLKDKTGAIVPDGTYKINLEFTEINGSGKYLAFSFNKTARDTTITPADQNSFKSMSFVYTAPVTGINETTKSSNLKLNSYPNPFNNNSTINFTVKETAPVSLEIYDIKGSLVKTLVHRQLEKGDHSAFWEGTSNAGVSVASGTYFYILKCGNQSDIKKTLLLK